MSKKYYHLFCLQNSVIMESGRNSESLEELREGLLSYISVDYPEDEDDSEEWNDWQTINRMSVQEIAELWEFSIEITSYKL